MAVIVRDFTWTQTTDHVIIRVPLRGVHSSKVDLVTHDAYVKASFKPFIFESFLLHPIEECKSEALIVRGEIVLRLQKKEQNVHWECLSKNLTKEEKCRLRKLIIDEVRDQQQSQSTKKQELLQHLQRKAVQQQINLETKEKAKIEELRNTERENAMQELDTWKKQRAEVKDSERIPNIEKSSSASCLIQDSAGHSSSAEQPHLFPSTTNLETKDLPSHEKHNVWHDSEEEKSALSEVQLNEEDFQPVPFTRKSGCIKIKFTPRAFPTPQRESKTDEEQEWLKKQAEARRATGFVAEDLRPEECNPSWLKDKGDSFYKVGNYLGAVSAYSHGIKLSDKMASLYVNRSAAHLALGNLKRAIEDTSMALDLMVPKVKLNEESRAKCHARRGAALCKLGMLDSGLNDLEEAFKLKPNDCKLCADIVAVKKQIKTLKENDEKKD